MTKNMRTINVDGQVVPLDNYIASEDEDAMSYVQMSDYGIDDNISNESEMIQIESNQQKMENIIRQAQF
jgi:hypothetical protein